MFRPMKVLRKGVVQSRIGFTAIEVSAVATIIAILALVLIPIVRGRVEEARIVAAQDDMMGIEKAQSIVFATTGQYVTLFHLDLINQRDGNGDLTYTWPGSWNVPTSINPTLDTVFNAQWGGPYVAQQNTINANQMIGNFPWLLHSPDIGGLDGGPIRVQEWDRDQTINDFAPLRYPIDPWGSPYIFFGPTAVGDLGGGGTNPAGPPGGVETNFGFPVVYSLGPNGAPGDLVGGVTNPQVYYREAGVLGTGDDLTRNF